MDIRDLPLKGYLKPLLKYLEKKDIVEICVNKEGEIALEDIKGQWHWFSDKNITRELFETLAKYLANKTTQRFGADVPSYAGTLPGYGYRLQINCGAMVQSGLAVSIRISQASKYPLTSYMSEEKAEILSEMVKDGKTILVCGATGSGKTTLLNALIDHIPQDKRIITLQDTPELVVSHRNAVHLIKSKTESDIAGLKYKHFMNAITRLRPDRILLGEIDTDNVLAFLKLANIGHSGSISTIHASNPVEALNSLCTNVQMSGESNATVESIYQFAKQAIDCFITIKKINTPTGRQFVVDYILREDVKNEL
uniref:Type II/IV secretion system ATP hydrolase TadA/VirB11/CpaF, TadA subfamily n=1 Tax=Vibrio sp. FF_291 TaxID=1652832 RepID=A0A0H3ZMV0_9VIBR|nr:Type II/IV secretion system ATP hydrolase TadA/VirB11/CpaF, TadA subfamily [Vibrio sp. FF_291]